MAKTARGEKQNFLDVLQDELRREIRAELLSELSAAGTFVVQQKAAFGADVCAASNAGQNARALSAHEKLVLWLNTNFHSPLHTQDAPAQTTRPIPNAYQTRRKNSSSGSATLTATCASNTETKSDSAEPVTNINHSLDVRDIAALEFFRRNGADLKENFNQAELRSAYRQIAMKLHPDRHHQATEIERATLNQAFSELTELTEYLARHLSH